jgi:MFS family permease
VTGQASRRHGHTPERPAPPEQPAPPATSTVPARPHRAAVAAVAVVFTLNGIAMAAAVSRMPDIKAHIGASPTELAFALVCVGIGSVVAMPFAGRLVQRFGTRAICLLFATVAVIAWSLVPLAGSVPQLAVILLFAGAGIGTWDVAMNVQGSIVERHRHQVLMPLWHGLFSAGAVVGALIGAASARLGIIIAWQLPVVSIAVWIGVLASTATFVPNDPVEPSPLPRETVVYDDVPAGKPAKDVAAQRERGAARSGITRVEILLGLITLGTALGEGAANDWLAIALVDGRGAPAAIGALTLAGFNVTMAIGRFAGGPIIARIGRVAALRAAGLIAASGVLVLCLIPATWTAFVGAAAWGLGLAIVFPSAMSAAGEVPGRRGRAIATVSTIGYGGFLFGAPLIGVLAHLMPLLHALLAVAAVVMIIVILAPAARERGGVTRTVAEA